MKVVIFSRGISPSIGGQEVYTRSLKEFLERRGIEVQVFTRKYRDIINKEPNIKRISFLNIPVIRFILLILNYMRYFIKTSKKSYPNLLIANDVLSEGLSGALIKKFFKVPLIITVHGGGLYSFSRKFGFITKWIFSQASRIIVPNRYLRDLSNTYVKDGPKIVIIPHGIDTKLTFAKDQEASSILIRELGLENRFVLLVVARLVTIKCIDVAIKALKIIINDGLPASLIIIGQGPEREKLERLTRKLKLSDNVLFLGGMSPERLKKYYAISNAFLLTSKNEGVGLVLLEAMAHGIPIVATRVGGIPELVFDNQNGFLVDIDNHEQVARFIKTIKNDPGLKNKVTKFDQLKLQREHDIIKNFQMLFQVIQSIIQSSTS